MKNILLALLMTSCGAQQGANPNAEPSPSPAVDYQPSKKEVVVEYRKNGTVYAVALTDTKDMPACDKNNSKQLVYIKNQDKFYSCENEAWEALAVKGEKGDPGAPATPVPVNQWFDPITSKYWLIGGGAVYANVNSTFAQACTGSWRMPTTSEVQSAGTHGLGTASASLGGPTDAWSSNVYAELSKADVITLGTGFTIAKPMTESHGVFCIQK